MTIEYLKKHILDLHETVLDRAIAIYVYGSVARNDNDQDSDCDLLVCIDDCSEREYLLLKDKVSNWEANYGCEFAFYQMSTLKEMHKKGSYFLWHIKKEGILLYQRTLDFRMMLDCLPEYTETKADFLEYREILNDVALSLKQDSTTIEYDLSVLAVLARNICIGCCYLIGDMDFGRKTPVIKCIKYFGESFPISLFEYNELYEFRFAVTRKKNINSNNVSEEYILRWLEKVQLLLDLAMNLMR